MTRGKFAFENFSISLENMTTSVRFLISIPFVCSAMRNGTLFHSSYSLPRLRKLRALLQWHIKLFNVPAMFIVRLCPSAMQVMFLLSVLDTSIMDKVEKKACVWDWNLIPVKKRNDYFEFWLVHCTVCVLCDWLEWLLWVLIGSQYCLCGLWLTRVISMVLIGSLYWRNWTQKGWPYGWGEL